MIPPETCSTLTRPAGTVKTSQTATQFDWGWMVTLEDL